MIMPIELVDLRVQYQTLREAVLKEIETVLSGMQLVLGENVFRLEEEFAQYCGARFAVGVGSGTDAVYLALRACDVGPGDEVITVSHTFIATIEAIALTGARPAFVDIDPVTYTMDPGKLEAAITPRTKAVVPVHLYGHPADMDPILAIARRHNLRVVEDACQAHGAQYKGRTVGTIGDVGAFSFYPSKNLGAYGEGGMVVTMQRSIATTVQILRNHGQKGKYQHVLLGLNSRLDELQAAILRLKLRSLDQWNTLRRTWAAEYDRRLANIVGVVTPVEQPYAKHVYHLYVIRAPQRDALREALASQGIATGIHYPVPTHLQEACQQFGCGPGSLPVTEAWAKNILSLPMYPELTVNQIGYMCQTLIDQLRSSGRRRGRRTVSSVVGPSV